MSNDLFSKILTLSKNASSKQRLLAEFVMSHFEELPFLTSTQIAAKGGVSEATVVRFAKLLGYRGLPELKDEFQKLILRSLGPHERLKRTALSGSGDLHDLITATFDREVRNLKDTHKRLSPEILKEIAETLIHSRSRYIVGLRASSACAFLLGHYLSHILPRVVTILDGDTKLFEGLKSIGREDVLVLISYSRYTRASIQALEYGRDRGAKTIAITDTASSPPAQIADQHVVAPSALASFANSYTACIVVINLLVGLIAERNKDESERMLSEWDSALQHLNAFYKLRTAERADE